MSQKERPDSVICENRRARFDYYIEDTYEAGLALQGTEVKALRAGEASIAESYAEVKDGQVWLINANIPEFIDNQSQTFASSLTEQAFDQCCFTSAEKACDNRCRNWLCKRHG